MPSGTIPQRLGWLAVRETKVAAGLAAQPEIGCNKAEKNHRDDAVHGEEGGVETTQIPWRNDGVLVRQQQSGRHNAQPTCNAEVKEARKPAQQAEHREMHDAGGPERSR